MSGYEEGFRELLRAKARAFCVGLRTAQTMEMLKAETGDDEGGVIRNVWLGFAFDGGAPDLGPSNAALILEAQQALLDAMREEDELTRALLDAEEGHED